MTRQQICEGILGEALEPGGFAPCPGKHLHTGGKCGAKDFRVNLDGAPTGYCFHTHCGSVVEDFNKQLRRAIWQEENGGRIVEAPRGHWAEDVAAEPKEPMQSRPELDTAKVAEFTRGVPPIDEAWLARRSPLEVTSAGPVDFLTALFKKDERVLIFTSQTSQGDFVFWGGRGTFRLSQQKGVKAVESKLPRGGRDGVWYLCQPVTAQWAINANAAKMGGDAKWSRRSEGNVTAWRHFVLESDELPAADWLKILVSLPFPITAIYTSGGRSIHALVCVEVESKAMWDGVRNMMRQIVCPLGADPAALTAVRLTRLPGCYRGDRLQRLLYLNPEPDHSAIRLMPELRA